MTFSLRPFVLAAIFFAIGVGVAGYLVGQGLTEFRMADRTVSVKGLAERDVKADLALWNLRYAATGPDVANVQAKIDADGAVIADYLQQQGFGADDLIPQRPEVIDMLANQYRSQGAEQNRFIIYGNLQLRTTDVDRVNAVASKMGDLIKKGVVLDNSNGTYNTPYYLFTKLNDIKPAMIAEATKNARAAAEQFAADSGARLGGIRTASQGYFSILPGSQTPGADESTQMMKTIRLVTGIDYRLE
ncbi:MAG: SIMPL domain-containing protein [Alphaproteobacteria bacterium]|nr:SIMPL domain-containing protein [Alphaproteobacteria bacterium]